MTTLAIYGADDPGAPAVAEWLRVLAALVACGEAPEVIVLPGFALDADQLGDEATRTLDQLASFDVVPRPAVDPGAVLEACARATRILRVGGPPGGDLLVVDDAALTIARDDPAAFAAHLASAGPVVRALP